MEEKSYVLGFDAFLRSFGLLKNGKYAFLLGAGCSISSGLPSAQQCIWDWKKAIYSTRNKVNSPIFDARQDNVQKTIQNWLDSIGGFPTLGSDEEYATYVEIAYPIEADRKEYFAQLSRNAKPSIGYRLLIELFRFGKLASVWSTNFDGLVERAAHKVDVPCVNVNINTADLIYSQPYSADLLYVALHGDYKYTKLKNTATELDRQVTVFEQSLQNHLSVNSLVVIGYSGRDKSLMNALKAAYSKPGSGRLFWVGYGNYIPESVKELISHCRENNREAYFINGAGFDEVMLSIMEHCFYEDPEKRATIEGIKNTSVNDISSGSAIQLNTGNIFNSKLKLNLYPLKIPRHYYQIDTARLSPVVNDNLTELIKSAPFVATVAGTQIFAFATISQLVSTFSISSPDALQQVQMPVCPLINGTIKNLLIKAVLFGLSSKHSTLHASYGDKILWSNTKRYDRIGYEGLKINLYPNRGNDYVLVSFSPTIFFLKEENYTKLQKQNTVRRYIDSLKNKEFYNKLSEWESDIFSGKNFLWQIPLQDSGGCTFTIGHNSAFGGVFDPDSTEPKFALSNREIWSGKRIPEPKLRFANPTCDGFIEDANPMRGLLLGRPLERCLNLKSNSPVYIGVICPYSYTDRLYNFLGKLNSSCVPRYFDYIQPYPGFENAYSNSLNIPNPTDKSRWIQCNDIQRDGKFLASKICEFSQKMSENYPNFTIIVFIPQKWESIKEEISPNDSFNLHNYIKAFGAQSRITTQFIEEKSLSDLMDCEKRWWLSLALFVKAQRLPWTLTNLNQDSAYAGIGFSIDRSKNKGQQLVIGCSHLYNSQGQGLKYRLRNIENPLWIDRKNPYLSETEAYKFGLSILDLFHESMERFPKRVVIHKRTDFQSTEINGLRKSFATGGVKEIDLISITEEHNIKAISQIASTYGISTDTYPLKRGICIQISDDEILLWTHGAVPSVQSGRLYYAGGRAIPSPLKIKRCFGSTDIETIAKEVLSFTKMDWNSFNFYSKIPATVSTSNLVAQIGRLLSHYPNQTFDYRFFI